MRQTPSLAARIMLLLVLATPASAFVPSPCVATMPRPTSSGVVLHASNNNGGLEGVFKFIRSDALSLGVGSLALLALVTNRLYTDPLFDSQSRTDILGVFSAGGLLLNGLTLQVSLKEK
jgi:hypothetical protein